MTPSHAVCAPRRKAVWGPKRGLIALLLAFVASGSSAWAAGAPGVARSRPGSPNSNARSYKLDNELAKRAARANTLRTTRVIVEWQPGARLPAAFRQYARRNGNLSIINGQVLDLPDGLLQQLAANPSALRIHYDRPAFKHNLRTALTTGSRAVQQALGYTGAGIGVAVIDSGITSWHDDLTNRSTAQYPYGNQRVSAFVDFVNGQTFPYDDDGHGTHVAGIIAGNGYDSNGQKAGVAPDASLVVLKVLDQNGAGSISNVISALNWVLDHHDQYNIRVVNLSVGAAVNESYWTDPLTLAAKRLVDAGVVVVAAAGNLGTNALGQPQYGGIGAPGNAPWVLTVGASSTNGTPSRSDDTMASFSSRGPTYLDWSAKPDLVAPGVGTVSLAAPGSTFFATRPQLLLPGSILTASAPYMSLSGTSMAAPVVSGAVALMLQANPTLTPNAIKAILQYTAEARSGYDPLTEGAGFLNTVGAIRLARFFATAKPGDTLPAQSMWSKHLIWGNHMISGGVPLPNGNAYKLGTTWGAAISDTGDNIVWGTACGTDACDNIVWGTAALDNIVWGTVGAVDNIVWGTVGADDNIVWGTACGGGDCDNIVWGTVFDNIVWGTVGPDDNIVWGTGVLDNIVWGTTVDDNIVWGTVGPDDNIVWGTLSLDNIVWGTAELDNIVWGTVGPEDNIVWGTSSTGAPVLWDTTANMPVTWDTLHDLIGRLRDDQVFNAIVALAAAPPPAVVPVTPPPPPPVVIVAPPTGPAPLPLPSPTPITIPTIISPTIVQPAPAPSPTLMLAPTGTITSLGGIF